MQKELVVRDGRLTPAKQLYVVSFVNYTTQKMVQLGLVASSIHEALQLSKSAVYGHVVYSIVEAAPEQQATMRAMGLF